MKLQQLHREAEHGSHRRTGSGIACITYKRELAEFVLMVRPPVDGAEVLGANMTIGECSNTAAPLRNNNLRGAVPIRFAALRRGFFRGPKQRDDR